MTYAGLEKLRPNKEKDNDCSEQLKAAWKDARSELRLPEEEKVSNGWVIPILIATAVVAWFYF